MSTIPQPLSDATVGEPLLRIEDLHVTFAPRAKLFGRGRTPLKARAVDGVNLDLAEGEIIALAGESGCGKTSLARAIMGFVRPDSGRIVFEGEPLGKNLRAYRRKVQMVYQDPTGALNPRQTVYDSVAEGLRIHKVPGDEEELVAGALSRAGPASSRAVLPALPARALGRAATAGRDRRGARAGASGAHRR